MPRTSLRTGAVAVAATLVLAAPATAKTFCVGKPACAGETATSLQQAVDKAAASAGPDRIELGTGEFAGSVIAGSANPVEVVGAGRDLTTLTGTGATRTLGLGAAGASVKDLTVVAANGWPGIDGHADTLVERVRVLGGTDMSSSSAIILRGGGTVRDVQVDIGLDQQYRATAINFAPGQAASSAPVLVEDVTTRAHVGVEVGQMVGPVVLRRIRATASLAGISVTSPAPQVAIGDVAVHLPPHPVHNGPGLAGAGIVVASRDLSPGAMSVAIRHATLVGREPYVTGLRVRQNMSAPIAVDVRDSVMLGGRDWAPGSSTGTRDLTASGFGEGPVSITADHSAWRDGAVGFWLKSWSFTYAGRGNVDLGASPAGLADPEGGDLRPVTGSALVDNGGPDAGEGLDVLGAPRVVDGDGDGAPVRDIGAFEAAPGTNPGHVAPALVRDVPCPASGCAPAAVPAPPAPAANRPPTATLGKLTATRLQGRASDPDGKVTRVVVSITKRSGTRCLAYDGRRFRAAGKPAGKTRSCAPRFLLVAKGTRSWTLQLKRRLPRGTYMVRARAEDDRGGRQGTPVTRTLRIGR